MIRTLHNITPQRASLNIIKYCNIIMHVWRAVILSFYTCASHGYVVRGAASKWLLLFLLILAWASRSMEATTEHNFEFIPMVVTAGLLAPYEGTRPGGIWALRTFNSKSDPVILAGEDLVLVGRSSTLPAIFYEREWPESNFVNGLQDDSIANLGTSGDFQAPSAPPSPPPENPPPPPPSGANFSALDWRTTARPAIRLLSGQRLAMKSMAFYTVGCSICDNALTGQVLSQLSFSAIELQVGAVLELEDIVMILSCIELRLLQQALCSSPNTWPYNPGVVIEDGVMRITNLTSRAPGPANGVPGAGGQVKWLNVTLTCRGFGLRMPRPCAARAVANGSELYTAARKALVDESAATVILSITEDVALQTENGIWTPIPLRPSQQLVLLGDPSRPASTQLDLSGMVDAWRLESMTISAAVTRPLVLLYDLLLANIPYPVRPNGPISLLAASLPCFGITRGVLEIGVEQLHLIRSTVVVPDLEVDFLAGAAAGLDSSDIWPGQPSGSFAIMSTQNISYTSMESKSSAVPQLAVSKLKLMSEVLMIDCVLMSASSYQQRPSAIPLLPQLSAWLPELMTVQDPTVGQWGPGGLAMFLGLQQALADLARCDSRPGYTASRRIWSQHDTSIPPLEDRNSSTAPLSVTLSTKGALASPATCTVDGSLILNTTHSPPQPLQAGGGRAFSDLKGAINRFSLVRPITLRNLVLYNLAPGEAYPISVTGRLPPPLRPSDAAWANSSLPLWVFDCARSDADLTSQLTLAELTSLSPNNKQNIDDFNNTSFLRLPPPLVLENVTLVVPEREWKAMVAAVLLVHIPDAMRAAQLRPRQPPKQPPPRQQPLLQPSPYPGEGYWTNSPGQGSTVNINEMEPSKYHIGSYPNLPDNFFPAEPAVNPGQGSTVNTINEMEPSKYHIGSYPNLPDNFFPAEPAVNADPRKLSPPLYPLLSESTLLPPSYPDLPLPSLPEPSAPYNPPVSPTGPLFPTWPSPPQYIDTTVATLSLQSFAAASKVLSYNYHAGELVLAVARHYGWSGINVTITYKLPADAPAGATLLSYPELILPYDDLADMDVDLQADFSQSPIPAPASAPTQAPAPKLKDHLSDPSQVSTTTSDTPYHTQPTVPLAAEASSPATPSNTPTADRPTWLVPVVVCMSVLGGALVLSAALIIAFRHGRRGDRNLLPTHQPAQVMMRKNEDGIRIEPSVANRSQDPKQKQPEVEVSLSCNNGRTVAESCNSPTTEACILASPTAALCMQPNICKTISKRQRRTNTAEVYKVALEQLLVLCPSGSLDGSHAAGSLQNPSGLVPAELKLKVEHDRGGSGSDKTPHGRETSLPAVSNVDILTFLRELDVYFSKMDSAKTASSALHMGGLDTKPNESALLGQHSQGMYDLVKIIQAEIRDPDLHLEAMIAHGTFGAVYRGVWRGLPVAVKTMVVATEPDSITEGRQARQLAVQEAAISLSMAHPNVVVTYSYDVKPLVHAPIEMGQGLCDAARTPGGFAAEISPVSPNRTPDVAVHGQQQGDGKIPEMCGAIKLYIIQEYCNGGTLRGALDWGMAGCIRVGGLAGMLARRLALDVALGMEHIHSCRIVHGDLKPENVLLVSSNQAHAAEPSDQAATGMDPVSEVLNFSMPFSAETPFLNGWSINAKVADFGLSTPLPEGATHASKAFHGTPAYVAPEVAAAGHLSPHADIWSFGVVLIELYYGCSMPQILGTYNSAVSSSTISLECGVLKDLIMRISDHDYATIVARCLALEPRERPNFGELVAALQAGDYETGSK
ncbi:hypothetical protein Vretifemale_4705 [Volvox reticuliferus]|uniref:Protein kinase domain-containing protein n=1 Tax=Volvox reticuliferus TaxID=1737510 RepID=A0A8J4FH46_9CHLO|nr:hypothetical protein Vretifemale_4705 [Volvox reticuliferus]